MIIKTIYIDNDKGFIKDNADELENDLSEAIEKHIKKLVS